MPSHKLRIGYVPYDESLTKPGDRRRFCFYAQRRELPYKVVDGPVSPNDFDVIVLSARADISYWRRFPRGGAALVFDLIDSYLAIPRNDIRARLRGPAKFVSRETRSLVLDYRRGLEEMCTRADAVVCSTPEQQDALKDYSNNIHAILDAHDELVHGAKRDYAIGDTVNLVWEGLPYTLHHFSTIRPVLFALADKVNLNIHIVTDLVYAKVGDRFWKSETRRVVKKMLPMASLYQWNQELLGRIVTACDIALIPIDLTDPFAYNKPENKLLIFLRMGVPAVVSATPAYSRVMGSIDPSLACSSPEDWYRTLESLISDQGRRERVGAAGLQYVDMNHRVDDLIAAWDRVFETV